MLREFTIGRRGETVNLSVIDWDDFSARHFHYDAGQHVLAIGPTGSGKTTLLLDLLGSTCSPDMPGVVIAMKPKDSTIDKWMNAQRKDSQFWQRAKEWPAPWRPFSPRPHGVVLWPDHKLKAKVSLDYFDDIRYEHFSIYRQAMIDCYRKQGKATPARGWGGVAIFCDEAASLVDLGLAADLENIWSKGRSMGCGIWSATQRPRHVPLLAYQSSTHVFVTRDTDASNRARLGEISGGNGHLVPDICAQLARHEWLYHDTTTGAMCVIPARHID